MTNAQEWGGLGLQALLQGGSLVLLAAVLLKAAPRIFDKVEKSQERQLEIVTKGTSDALTAAAQIMAQAVKASAETTAATIAAFGNTLQRNTEEITRLREAWHAAANRINVMIAQVEVDATQPGTLPKSPPRTSRT